MSTASPIRLPEDPWGHAEAPEAPLEPRGGAQAGGGDRAGMPQRASSIDDLIDEYVICSGDSAHPEAWATRLPALLEELAACTGRCIDLPCRQHRPVVEELPSMEAAFEAMVARAGYADLLSQRMREMARWP